MEEGADTSRGSNNPQPLTPWGSDLVLVVHPGTPGRQSQRSYPGQPRERHSRDHTWGLRLGWGDGQGESNTGAGAVDLKQGTTSVMMSPYFHIQFLCHVNYTLEVVKRNNYDANNYVAEKGGWCLGSE